MLVGASSLDTNWGAGIAQDSKDVFNPFKWEGLNLLGGLLMQVRGHLQLEDILGQQIEIK